MSQSELTRLARRAFLKHGSLLLTTAAFGSTDASNLFAETDETKAALRIALISDLHYAHKPPAGSRHYRETPTKLAEAAAQFAKDKPQFIVELGDLIDAADSVETELAYLSVINKTFAAIGKDRHCVLGNHCVDTLTKEEFLGAVGQKDAHYSFDREGFHFVVLDACFRADGKPYQRKNFTWTDANIPAGQVEWLADDLKRSGKKTIIFAHQRLDIPGNHAVKNAPIVRKALEKAGNVLAVFQGHSHKNDYHEVAGIHYCTLAAMIEGTGEKNNSYTTMDLYPGGTIKLTGYRQQKAYEWKA
ncbi:MAG: metallophosphoesterase [Phycisphaeraceae bacterium]